VLSGMDARACWCRVTVVRHGSVLRAYDLECRGETALDALDRVARLALAAVRLDARIGCSGVAPRLRGMLELAGLAVEVQRETEGGEEALGIQEREEEAHGGDPPV